MKIKNVYILTVALIFSIASFAVASTTFTDDAIPSGDYTADTNKLLDNFRTSKNVILVADNGGDQTVYTVAAGHTQGNKIYSSTSNSSTIKEDDVWKVDAVRPTQATITAKATGIDPLEDEDETED